MDAQGTRAEELAHRLRDVRQRIAIAGGADLLPITKFHPVEDVQALAGFLSLIHISEPTRLSLVSRMPSSA